MLLKMKMKNTKRSTSFISLLTIGFVITGNLTAQTFGNALEFDGLNDYVFVGNDTNLQVDQFTLTAWVHPYSYSEPIPEEQRMEIFEKTGEYWMNISTSDKGWQRDMGEVRVGGIFEGEWHFLDSEFVVPLKEWTHVACTYDGDSIILYINGKYDVAKAIPENHTDKLEKDNMLALGCKCVAGEFGPFEAQFHGMLDEMSIWNTALTQNEIEEIKNKGIEKSHNKWSELKAYYKTNEDKIGENVGDVFDETGINDGYNYGAIWVINELERISTKVSSTQTPMLQQNYPNPFTTKTYIPISLNKSEFVTIDIYNITGKKVENLLAEELQSGEQIVEWNASVLPKGIYMYTLRVGEYSEIRRCVIE